MADWNLIAKKIKEADATLIGASNGLSITEGLHLFADNEAFEKLFGDFKRKYGLRCILQGMMAQWPSEEEKWAFWARLIHHYCGQYRPTPVMEDLKAIVGDKDYFVVTSNGECHFELCGFDPDKRVLVLDGDPQGDTSKTFGRYEPEGIGMSELLEHHQDAGGRYRTTELIQSTEYDHIDIIPANGYLMQTDMNLLLKQEENQVTRLRDALAEVAEAYDYCICDCGRLLDMVQGSGS